MAFAFSIESDGMEVWGKRKVVFGTYTNTAGSTGGEVETGLSRVEGIFLQPTGTAVSTNANAANETFPLDKGEVTIVTDANEDGLWIAVGI